MKARGHVLEAASTLLLLLLVIAVGVLSRRLAAADEMVSVMTNGFRRAQVQDRLTGAMLDLEPLGIENAPERRAVWFLDLERCLGCVDTTRDWALLDGGPDLALDVVIAGEMSLSTEARFRGLRRTTIHRVSNDDIRLALGGNFLASTKILLDSRGMVLLADSRAGGQECGWSFDAQMANLLGLDPHRPIRPKEVLPR